MNYLDSILLFHCFVSFSQAKHLFFISLWNGVLRDGKVDDIDIHFFEATNPSIFKDSLSFFSNNQKKNIILSIHQLKHLSLLFPEFH
jgi:hypothetical protein